MGGCSWRTTCTAFLGNTFRVKFFHGLMMKTKPPTQGFNDSNDETFIQDKLTHVLTHTVPSYVHLLFNYLAAKWWSNSDTIETHQLISHLKRYFKKYHHMIHLQANFLKKLCSSSSRKYTYVYKRARDVFWCSFMG